MRRLADRLGMRASSIYKHVPDKATLEVALVAEGLAEALPRDRLATGLEARAAEPVLAALGDSHRARVAWAAAHGFASLELAGRFPADADVDAAWAAMVRAFAA
jgi:AcrR family transcriptional regulator